MNSRRESHVRCRKKKEERIKVDDPEGKKREERDGVGEKKNCEGAIRAWTRGRRDTQ